MCRGPFVVPGLFGCSWASLRPGFLCTRVGLGAEGQEPSDSLAEDIWLFAEGEADQGAVGLAVFWGDEGGEGDEGDSGLGGEDLAEFFRIGELVGF